MYFILVLYTVLLFVLLTPAILVRLPPNGNKWTVAFVHGLIFALVYHFTHHFFSNLSYGFEGFWGRPTSNNRLNVAQAQQTLQAQQQQELERQKQQAKAMADPAKNSISRN